MGIKVAKKPLKIMTTNREIYEKLHTLNFTKCVCINSSKQNQIENIIKKINKNTDILRLTKNGDKHIIDKITNNLNFDIYFNNKNHK